MNKYLMNQPPWDLNALPSLIYEPAQVKRREFYDLVIEIRSYYGCGHDSSIIAYIGLLNALILLLNEVSLVGGVLDYCQRKNPSNYGLEDNDQTGLKESLILLRNELRNFKRTDLEARTGQIAVRCGHPDLTWGRFYPHSALRLLEMIAKHGIDESVSRKLSDTANKKGMIGIIQQTWLNPSDIFLEDRTSNEIWESAIFCFGDLIEEYNQEKTNNLLFEKESYPDRNTHSIEAIRNSPDLTGKLQITGEVELARYNIFTMTKLFRGYQAEHFVRGDFPTERDFWNGRNSINSFQINQFDTQNKNFIDSCRQSVELDGNKNEEVLFSGLYWFLITNRISFDKDFDSWRCVKAKKLIEYARSYKSPNSSSKIIEQKTDLTEIEGDWKSLCQKLSIAINIYENFKLLNPRFIELRLADINQ